MLGPVSWSVPVATADGMVNRPEPSLYTTSNEDGTRPPNDLCGHICFLHFVHVFLLDFMPLSAQLYVLAVVVWIVNLLFCFCLSATLYNWFYKKISNILAVQTLVTWPERERRNGGARGRMGIRRCCRKLPKIFNTIWFKIYTVQW